MKNKITKPSITQSMIQLVPFDRRKPIKISIMKFLPSRSQKPAAKMKRPEDDTIKGRKSQKEKYSTNKFAMRGLEVGCTELEKNSRAKKKSQKIRHQSQIGEK